MSFQVFNCRPGKRRAKCVTGCVAPAFYVCEFEFRGKASGQTCARALCAYCLVVQPDGKHYCKIHHDVARGAVR